MSAQLAGKYFDASYALKIIGIHITPAAIQLG